MTRSPGLRSVTPAPISTTSPAISKPGVKGKGGFSWYFPSIISVSPKLIPAAWTATRTAPSRSAGAGVSSTTRLSGGPKALHKTARIVPLLAEQRRGGPHRPDDAPGDVLDDRPQLALEPRPLVLVEDAEPLENAAHRDLGGAPGAIVDLERDAVAKTGEGAAEDALGAGLDAEPRARDLHQHRRKAAGAVDHDRALRHGVEQAPRRRRAVGTEPFRIGHPRHAARHRAERNADDRDAAAVGAARRAAEIDAA